MSKIISGPFTTDLDGKYTAFKGTHPVVLQLPQEPGQTWVPVFDNETMLDAGMKAIGLSGYKPFLIEKGIEFIHAITDHGLRIMLNPYRTAEGNTRWTEVMGFGD